MRGLVGMGQASLIGLGGLERAESVKCLGPDRRGARKKRRKRKRTRFRSMTSKLKMSQVGAQISQDEKKFVFSRKIFLGWFVRRCVKKKTCERMFFLSLVMEKKPQVNVKADQHYTCTNKDLKYTKL